jgi:hypothetical protein
LRQDAGEVNPLLFPARERGVEIVFPVREVDIIQSGAGRAVVLRAFASAHVRAASKQNDFKYGERKIECGLLMQVGAELPKPLDRNVVQGRPVELHGALCRMPFTGQDAEEGGLARSVGTEDRRHPAGLECQVDPAQNRPLAQHQLNFLRFQHGYTLSCRFRRWIR